MGFCINCGADPLVRAGRPVPLAQSKNQVLQKPGRPAGTEGTPRASAPLLMHRTPDVVEFAVSPQVGQAVLAFARSYSSSAPNSSQCGRAGEHRLPHLRSSGPRKEWLSPFSPPGTKCGARSGGLMQMRACRKSLRHEPEARLLTNDSLGNSRAGILLFISGHRDG
jgi:hypothetical protein